MLSVTVVGKIMHSWELHDIVSYYSVSRPMEICKVHMGAGGGGTAVTLIFDIAIRAKKTDKKN